MRKEEPLEDRKLLAVKSWFTRSLSSISYQNGSSEATSDGNPSTISLSKEGVVESGSGFAPLRQLSMRYYAENFRLLTHCALLLPF